MPDAALLEAPGRLGVLDEDAERFEVVNGLRVELEPMSVIAIGVASVLSARMTAFGIREELGLAFTEMLFVLDSASGLRRRPDVAFVPFSLWPDRILPSTEAWDLIPTIAVEVVSPSNRSEEIDGKLTDYFAAGVSLVWVVYPESRRVYVYNSPTDVEGFDETGELNGGDALPGFQLSIGELFASVTRPS